MDGACQKQFTLFLCYRIRRPSWTLEDFIKQYFSYYCTDELPLNPGRKFLHKLVREESARRNFLENSQPTEERDSQKSLLAPKMAVGALGMIMLCCSFLCPCFRARRKQADHTVLTKDLQSSESKCPIVLENIHVEILNLPLCVIQDLLNIQIQI